MAHVFHERWETKKGGLALLTLAIGLLIGCTSTAKEADVTRRDVPTAKERESIYVFFYIINKKEGDVEVKALADNKELFSEKIELKTKLPSEGEVFPPPGKYPVRELKVEIYRNVKVLEIKEMNSGLETSFDITDFSAKGAGFRISVEEDDILLTQDYYPIR